MLDVKPFQETLGMGMCGPATLKMLLMYWDMPGKEKTDIELSKECGTDPTLGTTNKQFMETAERFGLMCVYKEWSTFADIEQWLSKGVPIVADWFSPGRKDAPDGEMPDGHYSIAVGIDENHIYLQDPELGSMRTIPREQFLRVWFDYSGNTITEPVEHCMEIRVSIAVYPRSYNLP
ncbi:MAG: hypothetical protein RI911_761 [Candidatus Parcubacteria bacterium]